MSLTVLLSSSLALGLVAALLWGLQDFTIRCVTQSEAVLPSLLIVLTAGAVFQGAALVTTGEVQVPTPEAALISVAAGIAFLIASVTLFFALSRGPVALVSPLVATIPLVSISFALIAGEPLSGAQLLAVLAVVAGVGLVAALLEQSSDGVIYPPKGLTIVLSLLSAAAFGCTFALSQMAALAVGEQEATLLLRLVALVLLLGAIVWLRPNLTMRFRSWATLALVGVMDGVALLSVVSAASRPNPAFAAVTASIFGLVTILLAWLFLRERLRPAQWGGVALTFAAVGFLAYSQA